MIYPKTGFKFRVGILALLIHSLLFAALLPTGFGAEQDPPAQPPPASKPVDPKKVAAKLVYRFNPCVFNTPSFPAGSFEKEDVVQATLGPVKVETTFYNAAFEEVKEATAPGRYGAVLRITLGDGTRMNRFITLYRVPEDAQWKPLGSNIKIPILTGDSPEAKLEQENAIAAVLKDALGEESFSPKVAKLLMDLAQVVPGTRPESLLFNFMARDDAWWFELRKKIGLPKSYPFLIQLPDGYESNTSKRWPLILFLHGSSERGSSLQNVNRNGLPKQIASGRKIPAIVISPQCPENEAWSSPALSQLIDDVSAKNRVDPERVMVTGLSMGGFGTWALALAYPERFSAIAPVCGGGNPADAARLQKLPVWAFHGQLDSTVPVMMSEALVTAMRQAGGAPHLTIYPEAKHDSWTKAYATDALYTWLLAQQRGKPEVKTPGLQEP